MYVIHLKCGRAKPKISPKYNYITVQRHGIRNVELLERVVRFVFDNVGNRLNTKNIADYFKSQQRRVDINTVYNYLDALQGAFVIQRMPRYDIKGKEQLRTNEKCFVGDLSLIYAVMGYKDRMISGALENVVYWEMRRRGYDAFIGKQDSREVDFVGIRRGEKVYVQVTYRMESDATVEREFAPLARHRRPLPQVRREHGRRLAGQHRGGEAPPHRRLPDGRELVTPPEITGFGDKGRWRYYANA